MKRRAAGMICIISGVVLVACAAALFIFNRAASQRAGQSAQSVLSELEEIVESSDEDGAADPYDEEMSEAEVDGSTYIGWITIPALGLELPVQSSWSYPNLKISPCRYSGSAKSSDLIICAHNYSTHFGTIKNLSVGDDVYFTDLDGTTRHYEVYEVTQLDPYDIDKMTDSGYDLTLFTCTYGGQARVTVRCMETE